MNNSRLNNEVANNIVFDDGFKEMTINGDSRRVVRWNPSDINFIDRFLSFQEWVEGPELLDKLKGLENSNFSQDSDGDLNIEGYTKDEITNLGKYINKAIDDTFGEGFSKAAFLGANPLTPTSSGDFIFKNFIEALSPIIVNSFDVNTKAANKYANEAKVLKKRKG